MMKNKSIKAGAGVGLFLGAVLTAYAASSLFSTDVGTISVSPKTIFELELDLGADSGNEVGPQDSFSVNPVIVNDATENMYVFIKIDMPEADDQDLYTFETGADWSLVEAGEGTAIYAYQNKGEMISLSPGETTEPLTTEMTMRSITNAQYSKISDLNITVTGYAIGTEDTATDPQQAWNWCKSVGNIQ